MWFFLVAQLVARPTPEEAVRVLRSSHSDRDLTDYRAAPTPDLRVAVPVVVEHKPAQQPAAPSFPPLNCCGVYHLPAPHPVVEVIVRKEGR